MTVHRRALLAASLGLGIAATAASAADGTQPRKTPRRTDGAIHPELEADSGRDQTAILQAAIETAAAEELPIVLPPGKFVVSDLRLRSGTRLIANARTTTLIFGGGPAFLTADKADDLVLDGLVLDGAFKIFDGARGEGLLSITRSKNIALHDIEIRHSAKTGLALDTCSGRIHNICVSNTLDAGIKSLDAAGLDITNNTITDCANNGILVWRSEKGEDGTILSGNRISKIRNVSGGTGQFGNGINVFRAASVLVANNRICDCTYTAIRGNAASNIQIVANSCERLGEVAIYSEFGFEGALIANNVIDQAATGISVTNFNEGGRLAVIQGNLIRNLFRREHEPQDKRGEGIGVEADAAVTGNTIEGAPTVGIQIGWGPFMRDVAATGNVIRRSGVGITVTAATEAGNCLLANNLISDTRDGAIRMMTFGALAGPDLARAPATAGRITVIGNVAT